MTVRSSQAPWLGGLDGLRALAVVAVLAFHAGLGVVSGGFLGVDVFFVISGYLITALLLREFDASGRINLRGFWLRRARRLLPALFFLLAAVVVFVVLVLPEEAARLRGDVAAAFGYVTNWYLIADQQSYFESIGRPSMLRHLWSLAVEEQFYLLWPLVLGGALLAFRRRGALAVTVALAVASAVWMAALYDPAADPSRLYYGTDTRLFGLLIGAALAFVWVPGRSPAATEGPQSWRRFAPDAVAFVGLVALAGAFLFVDQYDEALYRGGLGAIALVTVVVIAAVVHPASVVGRRVLDSPLPRWIGRRSYSLYLWHWPVFAVTRPGIDAGLDPLASLALRLILTVALADVSYRFVETPVRDGTLTRAWQSWRRAAGHHSVRARVVLAGSSGLLFLAVLAIGGQVAAARPVAAPDYLPIASLQAVVGEEPGPGSTPGSSVLTAVVPMATTAPVASIVDHPGSAPTGSTSPQTTVPSVAPAAFPASAEPSTATLPAAPSTALDGAPAPVPTVASSGGPRARILALGDSVMLGAVLELGRALGPVEIDAEIGRQISSAAEILAARRDAGLLPDVVIIHVGSNGPATSAQLKALMDAVAGVPHVVLVNVRILDDFEGHNNRMLAQIAKSNGNVSYVDWFAATEGRPDLFWKDGEHVRPEGADLYANLIARALRDAGVPTR